MKNTYLNPESSGQEPQPEHGYKSSGLKRALPLIAAGAIALGAAGYAGYYYAGKKNQSEGIERMMLGGYSAKEVNRTLRELRTSDWSGYETREDRFRKRLIRAGILIAVGVGVAIAAKRLSKRRKK